MSGVKNLRAMFEQKAGDSPPDRGRSPGPNHSNLGESSPCVPRWHVVVARPLLQHASALCLDGQPVSGGRWRPGCTSSNDVRASAAPKVDGITSSWCSPTPSESPRPLSKVRTSFVAIEKDGRIGLTKRDASGDSVSETSRRLSNETENTTPAPLADKNDVFSDSVSKNAPAKMSVTSEPLVESPKQGTPARSPPKKGLRTPELAPSQNPDKVMDEEEVGTKLTSADPTSQAAVDSDGGSSKKSLNGTNGAGEPKEKPRPKPIKKTSTVSTTSRASSRPPRASSRPPRASSRPPKSPMVAHAPKSPTHEKAKAADKKAPAKDEAPKKAAAPKTTGRKELSPGAGVARKAKSPTRPVKLPPSLTTPTAASASKTGAPARQTQSRAAGNASNLGVPAAASQRPNSRASNTGAPAAPAPKLKRQNSAANRPRPSIGPPPKQQAKDHPPTKKDAHVDESFLARMMRPTQASSSKTTEKAPITPPRNRNGASSVKKSVTKDTEGNARKAGAKSVESSKTKGSPVEKKPKAAAQAEPTAKEVAPVAAQAGSAETAIEAAAASKDTAITPVVEKSQAQASESIVNSVTAASEELQAQMTNGNATDAGAAVSADAKEVKDVEDVVQKTSSLSLATSPLQASGAQDETDPFVASAPKADEASAEAMPAISTEDVQGEAKTGTA